MDKSQLKPIAIGAVAGAILMVIIGFAGLNWHLGGTVDKLVRQAQQDSMVASLSPICAANFMAAAKADPTMTPTFMTVDAWRRDSHLKDAGYATFPGTEANDAVAKACATLITEDL